VTWAEDFVSSEVSKVLNGTGNQLSSKLIFGPSYLRHFKQHVYKIF